MKEGLVWTSGGEPLEVPLLLASPADGRGDWGESQESSASLPVNQLTQHHHSSIIPV